jgi:hypothetical protein
MHSYAPLGLYYSWHSIQIFKINCRIPIFSFLHSSFIHFFFNSQVFIRNFLYKTSYFWFIVYHLVIRLNKCALLSSLNTTFAFIHSKNHSDILTKVSVQYTCNFTSSFPSNLQNNIISSMFSKSVTDYRFSLFPCPVFIVFISFRVSRLKS